MILTISWDWYGLDNCNEGCWLKHDTYNTTYSLLVVGELTYLGSDRPSTRTPERFELLVLFNNLHRVSLELLQTGSGPSRHETATTVDIPGVLTSLDANLAQQW